MENGGEVFVERGYGDEVKQALRDMGHSVRDSRVDVGGYQAILRDHAKAVYFGASESRKDGQAAGY